jgi:hypothetical protein
VQQANYPALKTDHTPSSQQRAADAIDAIQKLKTRGTPILFVIAAESTTGKVLKYHQTRLQSPVSSLQHFCVELLSSESTVALLIEKILKEYREQP